MRHLIVGLILLILGAWGIITWWADFGVALRGLVPVVVVLLGLAAVGAGLQKHTGVVEDEEEGSQEPSARTFAHPGKDRLAG